jgi:molybdopterin/thiamine biosynthesis adenylyltransferase
MANSSDSDGFDDELLLRYSRQLLLDGFDIAAQQSLADATLLLIGCGGLGSPAALYLAAAGIGRLRLADHDRVDLSNLQRQILFGDGDIGRLKVDAAKERLQQINCHVECEGLPQRLQESSLDEVLDGIDLVIDGSDTFATRHAINRACFRNGIPLVSGAVIRAEGQVSCFDPRNAGSPCYHCLYEEGGGDEVNCVTNGVLGPVAGMIGSIQAIEAIKLLTGWGSPLMGRLLLVDARNMAMRTLKLSRDPACPVCRERG